MSSDDDFVSLNQLASATYNAIQDNKGSMPSDELLGKIFDDILVRKDDVIIEGYRTTSEEIQKLQLAELVYKLSGGRFGEEGHAKLESLKNQYIEQYSGKTIDESLPYLMTDMSYYFANQRLGESPLPSVLSKDSLEGLMEQYMLADSTNFLVIGQTPGGSAKEKIDIDILLLKHEKDEKKQAEISNEMIDYLGEIISAHSFDSKEIVSEAIRSIMLSDNPSSEFGAQNGKPPMSKEQALMELLDLDEDGVVTTTEKELVHKQLFDTLNSLIDNTSSVPLTGDLWNVVMDVQNYEAVPSPSTPSPQMQGKNSSQVRNA